MKQAPQYYGDGKHDDWPWLDAQLRIGAPVNGTTLWISRPINTSNPAYIGGAITNCTIISAHALLRPREGT